MNSTINAFEEMILVITKMTNSYLRGNNGLINASGIANNISEKLSKSNAALSSGWRNVSETILKINNSLNIVVSEIIEDLNKFINETKKHENSSLKVVNNAIIISDEILNKLNIIEVLQ